MLPGYRFYPTEEELLSFYLSKQLEGENGELNLSLVIPVLDVYEHEPWDLPKLSGELCNGDTEQWFFFVPRQEKEIRGGRPSRITSRGYWKATGSPSHVYSSDERVIGMKKTLVFYKGKATMGTKTKWKMNEYRSIQQQEATSSTGHTIPKLRHEVSLCRVYVVSGNFGAFDRRPLCVGHMETANYQSTNEDPMNVTHPHVIEAVDHTNSLEASLSTPQVLEHYLVNQERESQEMEQGFSLWEWEENISAGYRIT